jgi:GNAT superfamily N-acetyltransferase
VELSLSKKGRQAFAPLNDASQREIAAMLSKRSAVEQQQLVDAMLEIQSLLAEKSAAYLLRDPRPGDMGWIVHRHGALYALEYGWDWTFEALVAEIVAAFVRDFDRAFERCWIAEQNGRVVGSVFVVRHGDDIAKLRLLYVEPSARGAGIGRRLVDECVCSGRTECSSTRAGSTKGRDFRSFVKSRTAASARIWSDRPGSGRCETVRLGAASADRDRAAPGRICKASQVALACVLRSLYGSRRG